MSIGQIIAWFFIAFAVILGTLVIGYYLFMAFIAMIGRGIWRMFQ